MRDGYVVLPLSFSGLRFGHGSCMIALVEDKMGKNTGAVKFLVTPWLGIDLRDD